MKETEADCISNALKSRLRSVFSGTNQLLILAFSSDVNCANHFVVTAFKGMPVFQKSDFESGKFLS